MSIFFSEIYDKAIALLGDPKLKIAYSENKIKFYKLMSPYLMNSFSLFTNPIQISVELSKYTPPEGKAEIFIGDGESKVFDLSFVPNVNSVYQVIKDGKTVSAIYDSESNTITLEDPSENGSKYTCEFYFAGKFDSDFNITAKKEINLNISLQVKEILSRLTVLAWGEHNRNFLLDIQNILTTSDFKLHPSALC